jgi:hypothetical protein
MWGWFAMINCMFTVFKICLSTVCQPWDLGVSNFSSAYHIIKLVYHQPEVGDMTPMISEDMVNVFFPPDDLRIALEHLRNLACWGQMYGFFYLWFCYLAMIPNVLLWKDNPSKIKLCVQRRCIDSNDAPVASDQSVWRDDQCQGKNGMRCH